MGRARRRQVMRLIDSAIADAGGRSVDNSEGTWPEALPSDWDRRAEVVRGLAEATDTAGLIIGSSVAVEHNGGSCAIALFVWNARDGTLRGSVEQRLPLSRLARFDEALHLNMPALLGTPFPSGTIAWEGSESMRAVGHSRLPPPAPDGRPRQRNVSHATSGDNFQHGGRELMRFEGRAAPPRPAGMYLGVVAGAPGVDYGSVWRVAVDQAGASLLLRGPFERPWVGISSEVARRGGLQATEGGQVSVSAAPITSRNELVWPAVSVMLLLEWLLLVRRLLRREDIAASALATLAARLRVPIRVFSLLSVA